MARTLLYQGFCIHQCQFLVLSGKMSGTVEQKKENDDIEKMYTKVKNNYHKLFGERENLQEKEKLDNNQELAFFQKNSLNLVSNI